MALRLADIGSPEVKIGQLKPANESSSANPAGSFRFKVTAHSGSCPAIPLMSENRSPSSGIRGHVPPEPPVTFKRNQRSTWSGIRSSGREAGVAATYDSDIALCGQCDGRGGRARYRLPPIGLALIVGSKQRVVHRCLPAEFVMWNAELTCATGRP